MIPALFLVICVVAFRAMTGLLIHSGAATWLSNFVPLAAIALCCAAYPVALQIHAPAGHSLYFRFNPERYLPRAAVRPANSLPLSRFSCRGFDRLRPAQPCYLENNVARVSRHLSDFLRNHQCLFLAD